MCLRHGSCCGGRTGDYVSADLEEHRAALKEVRIAAYQLAIRACRLAITELHLDEENPPVARLAKEEGDVAFAARKLVRATDNLPADRQPKGWPDA